MNRIQIVDYHRKYARSLAEMWNKSAASWGGFGSIYDEERVIAETEHTANLNTWLALDGEEVVGYCSFSEYREDQGASYIPLLNVRPDYHGKKVGKGLVLKAVERAIELGWPRLDLYTWPGNVKAVPLYKKCGFFWEDRDDTTHLMNLIPYVMQTEAAADYFRTADWYADSVRKIDVQPDGRKENGFEYLEYRWQRDGRMLRMEFERRGRGLRLIETDDYLISATVEDLKLVFDRTYKVTYRLVNKSGAPLNVELKGVADKNVRTDLDAKLDITGEETKTASFYVGPVEEEQSEWRTHPTVAAELLINGKKALFKVGIVPKFPAAIAAVATLPEAMPGQDWGLHLDWENNFRQRAKFEIQLPPTAMAELPQTRFALELDAGERASLPVPGTLRHPGCYSGRAAVTAVLADQEQVQFHHDIHAALPGAGAAFGGQNKDNWLLCNGRYCLEMSKFNNSVTIRTLEQENPTTWLEFPSMGLPWSAEFGKLKPRVEFSRQGQAATMEACFASQAMPGVELTAVFTLHASGLVEHFLRVANKSGRRRKLLARMAVRQLLQRAVLPLRGRVVEITSEYGRNLDAYPTTDFTENWLFVRGDRTTRGLAWPAQIQPRLNHGRYQFEHDLGELAPGQQRETQAITIALNIWSRWQDFRRYVTGKREVKRPVHNFQLEVNKGNPIVGPEFAVEVREHKADAFNGRLHLSSSQGSVPAQTLEFSPADAVRSARFEVEASQGPAVDQLELGVDFSTVAFSRRRVLFRVNGTVVTNSEIREGLEVLSVDNGVLRFSVAPDFAPAVFSLEHKGRQRLDSSFPTPAPRSWWNPWLGGSSGRLEDISSRSVLAQPRKARFVTVKDNKGNQWQGLEVVTTFSRHEKFRNLELCHYTLTLPGLPLLCSVLKVMQNTGRTLVQADFVLEDFLPPQGGWMAEQNQAGEIVTCRVSPDSGVQVECNATMWFGTEGTEEIIQYFTDGKVMGYLNPEILHAFVPLNMTVKHGEVKFTRPVFAILTPTPLPAASLADLKGIRF